MDNAQSSIAMQSNILYETVKEGLWGISSQGIRSEARNSVNFSLYIKSHWSRTKEQLQIRSTKTPLWGASERINEHWYTFAHSVLPWPQLHHGKTINDALKPKLNQPIQNGRITSAGSILSCSPVKCPAQDEQLGVRAKWVLFFCFSPPVYYPPWSPLVHRLSLSQRLKVSKKLINIHEDHSSHASPQAGSTDGQHLGPI